VDVTKVSFHPPQFNLGQEVAEKGNEEEEDEGSKVLFLLKVAEQGFNCTSCMTFLLLLPLSVKYSESRILRANFQTRLGPSSRTAN
jgi:hypothetical protein